MCKLCSLIYLLACGKLNLCLAMISLTSWLRALALRAGIAPPVSAPGWGGGVPRTSPIPACGERYTRRPGGGCPLILSRSCKVSRAPPARLSVWLGGALILLLCALLAALSSAGLGTVGSCSPLVAIPPPETPAPDMPPADTPPADMPPADMPPADMPLPVAGDAPRVGSNPRS